MDAREIESLSMISRGFAELKEANPALSYNIILDILSGINEYVFPSKIEISLHSKHPPETLLSDSMFKRLGDYSLTNALSVRAK